MSHLPTFLIIGAMKAGTTSLYAYLRAHPDVFVSDEKELDFFVAERNWRLGLDWYEGQFAGGERSAARGEASPNYTKRHLFDGVPARIREVIPDVRLIYVVRDPIARMRSHFVHNLAARRVTAPIGDVLLEAENYRLTSSYAFQLDAYLAEFEPDRILVVTAEDLYSQPARELERIFAFLELAPPPGGPTASTHLHRSSDKRVPRTPVRRSPWLSSLPSRTSKPARPLLRRLVTRPSRPADIAIPEDVEQRLRELLRPDVARLREILGPSFDGWGIA